MQRFTLSQNLTQSLRQEQIMAPQQIQALQILLATMPELEQRISEELAENPTLELLESGNAKLIGNPIEGSDPPVDADSADAARTADRDEALATLIQISETWRDYAPSRNAGRTFTAEDNERRQHLFDSLTESATLQDQLLAQLRELNDLDEATTEICRQIVGSIDDTGYLRTHLADIAITVNTDTDDVKRALVIVQGFEPAGVGARDLRECLLLQLERKGDRSSLAYQLVDKYLDEVGRNQIPKVARALNTSSTRLNEVLREIRKLAPFPGSLATDSRTDFVYPEVFVEKDGDGQWQVQASRDYRPRLRLSPQYLKLLQDPQTPADVRSYIRDKLGNSKMLLRAIEQRQSTIERIAESLLQLQIDFFEHGVEHMRPLTMSQVADDIGVHETTVSRAIANKYVQTPHGLFPFKHFFSSGYETRTGESVSSLSIKQKLQDLIDAENQRRPLSDQKLTNALAEQGFDVARRTVAKYREELGILPSHLRRSY